MAAIDSAAQDLARPLSSDVPDLAPRVEGMSAVERLLRVVGEDPERDARSWTVTPEGITVVTQIDRAAAASA